jgi:polyphosphate kinase
MNGKTDEISSRVPYYDRELSWMDFNGRVLEEALEKENPVMERVRFLAITASNLDEFFMVRVAGVMDQISGKIVTANPSGLSPAELYLALSEKIHSFAEKQYECLYRSIVPSLAKAGISFLSPENMSESQLAYVTEYFSRILFPVLTPLAVDRSRPFPVLANKSLNIAVRLAGSSEEEDCFAVVQVPAILSRYLELPGSGGEALLRAAGKRYHALHRAVV